MTMREWSIDYLTSNGMFLDQAEATLAICVADKAYEVMTGRWNDSTDGYPAPLLAVMCMALNYSAVQWIDANLPKAWYRPMFDGTAANL